MKNIVAIIFMTIVLISFKQAEENSTPLTDTTTPKVTGIGGIFFYSDNPQETKEWYTKNLGIEINDWGSSSFESRNLVNPDIINSLQWKPFKNGDEYFSPSKKDFMINYQVQNIEGLLIKLKENGVTILDSKRPMMGLENLSTLLTQKTTK